jgi:hypothetical protein
MWLFDNIFLDQNSPTAMLDPLLTDEQKAAQEEAKKKQSEAPVAAPTATAEAPTEVKSEASPVDAISFDEVKPESSTATPVATGGFLATPSNPVEEVSFDIGGFDMPWLDDAPAMASADTPVSGGSFLAGGTATPAGEVSFTVGAPQTGSVDSSSIALVQGATSATSDAIIDTGVDTSVPALGNPIQNAGTIQITEEPSTLVNIGAPEETIPATSLLTITSEEPQWDNSLFGMFSATDEAEKKTETITIQDTAPTLEVAEAPITEASILPSVESAVITLDTTTPTTPTPEMINFDTVTPISSIVTSSSDTESLVDTLTSTAKFSPDSPLHEMLSEFVSRLEKFNSESATLDIEMTASETALAKEQTDLQREYETRVAAIEYKRKHLERTRAERKDEKNRLERIITNLKKEIA